MAFCDSRSNKGNFATSPVGQDRTTVEIWADSALNRNTHQIQVDADSARFSMFIENIPSENPRTVESPRFRSSHTYVS
jgi:predicted dinucleotide-utilizing enzyme